MAPRLNPTSIDAARTDRIDLLLIGALTLLLIVSPLALGSVAPWARSMVFLLALLLVLLWVVQGLGRGRLLLAREWFWLPILGFFAIVAAQLVPLSPEILARLSPATLETWRRVLPEAATQPHPISLFPYGTAVALLRISALLMVFFVVAHTVRTRWQVMAIVIALLAVGLFEAFYGMGEQFSGHRYVFWQARTVQLSAVTGTFWNKNHFAGLLGMLLPMTLGFLLGTLPRQRGGGSARTRAVQALSSPQHHAPVLLALTAIILAVAICFSLSRAGIFSIILSLLTFAVCLGASAGFRRYTLILLAVVACVFLAVAVIGTEVVLAQLEDAAHGRAASWGDRLDLSRSGLQMAKEFPLFGAGLGSFRFVFERFQSARFGDLVADYLHNDWLQAFCETGLPGGAMLVVLAVLLIGKTLRTALRRQDPFCRWVAVGCLMGAGYMLLHSFFDYNLSKITGNGIIFATLCGLAYAVAHMPSDRAGSCEARRYWAVPLGPAPVRLVVGCAAVTGAVALSLWPARLALADFAFNRFLAASGVDAPDPYYLLPVEAESTDAAPALAAARRLDPGNPRVYYAGALFQLRCAQAAATKVAEETARQTLGIRVESSDPKTFARIVEAMANDVAAQSSSERASILRDAESQARRTLPLMPAAAKHHMSLAQVLSARAQAEPSSRTPATCQAIDRAIAVSLFLAPGKPGLHAAAGKLHVMEGLADPAQKAARLLKAFSAFRAAIAADPDYAGDIYTLVQATLDTPHAMIEATPRTFRAYRELTSALWNAHLWEAMPPCLDTLDELCVQQITTDAVSPWTLRPRPAAHTTEAARMLDLQESPTSLAPTARDMLERRLYVAQLRVTVLGLLGRWEERATAVRRRQLLLRTWAEPALQEARACMARHQYELVLDRCRQVLDQDWSNPDALLTAAEAAHELNRPSVPPRWESAVDHLYRLVISHDRIDEATRRRMRDILNRVPRTGAQGVAAIFVDGAASILAGQTAEGIGTLEALALRTDDEAATWRQRHLVWYYLGIGYSQQQQQARAEMAFRRVIEIVPAHYDALQRLAASTNDPAVAARVASLTGSHPCNIPFAGRVMLKSYRTDWQASGRTVGAQRPDRLVITCYWQFLERMEHDSNPVVEIFDTDGMILSQLGMRMSGASGRPYSVDMPCAGEVVTTSFALNSFTGPPCFTHIFFWRPQTPDSSSMHALLPPPSRNEALAVDAPKNADRQEHP